MSAARPAGLRAFASDNYAGVHPDVWAAMADADADHAVSYGEDPTSAALQEKVREVFGERAFAVPVFTGTAANVLALQALTPPWGSVVTAASSHLIHDEGGAPERLGRTPLVPVPTPDGRLTGELAAAHVRRDGFVHASQPAVVEIAQATELGTVYSAAQVREVADAAHAAGAALYMDGARLSNAAAALDLPLRAFTTDAGVDVVSYGGTKNGGLGAEAVIVLNPEAVVAARMVGPADVPGGDAADARDRARAALGYLRKQDMQLASKHRYLAAQLLALLTDDLGIALAAQANRMARVLADAVAGLDGVELARAPEANAVFARLDPDVAAEVRLRHPFYDWDAAAHEVRWMTSWDTTDADVESFVDALAAALRARRPR